MSKQPEALQVDIVVEHNGQSAIDLLAKNTGLTKEKLKQAMQKGAVWLTRDNHTQRTRRAKKELCQGDVLHLYYDVKVLGQTPQHAQLMADQGQYSVWYKPRGMQSQGSKWGDHTTLYRFAEHHLKPRRPAFIVHRLDRFASGLILLAHTKTMANAFSRMFENRQVEKRYQAIVQGRFPAGCQHYTQPVDEKPASTFATLVAYDEQQDRSLLEVSIETGRKHQIRRHLAWAGYPIIGDRLYGGINNHSEDLQLTCTLLAFASPLDESEEIYTLPGELLPRL